MSHTATWNDSGAGVVIACADRVEMIEGNMYFPPESLKMEFFEETSHTTTCGWKGTCNYYTVKVNGKEIKNVAWVYRNPRPAAKKISGYVAFYPDVVTK